MTTDVLSLGEPKATGVVQLRRSSLEVLRSVLRDPIKGLPPAVFEQKLAIGHNFGRTTVYVCDPVLIHELIVRKADLLHKGDEAVRVLAPALGDGLLTSDGASVALAAPDPRACFPARQAAGPSAGDDLRCGDHA